MKYSEWNENTIQSIWKLIITLKRHTVAQYPNKNVTMHSHTHTFCDSLNTFPRVFRALTPYRYTRNTMHSPGTTDASSLRSNNRNENT